MFVVQNDLFGNLIWIFFFFLPDNGIFFSSLFAVTQTFVPWILAVEILERSLFSDWKKEKIMVSSYIYPLALVSRNSTL